MNMYSRLDKGDIDYFLLDISILFSREISSGE